jgi:hypothetical protein
MELGRNRIVGSDDGSAILAVFRISEADPAAKRQFLALISE